MILGFNKSGQKFLIIINGKAVSYWDKVQGLVKLFPVPDHKALVQGISKHDMEQYAAASDDAELKAIIVKDCKENGCLMMTEAEVQELIEGLKGFKF